MRHGLITRNIGEERMIHSGHNMYMLRIHIVLHAQKNNVLLFLVLLFKNESEHAEISICCYTHVSGADMILN